MRNYIFFLVLLFFLSSCQTPQQEWQTPYERSGGLETASLQETYAYFERLAKVSPYATVTTLGNSAENREIQTVIISRDGYFTPGQAKKSGKPVVLLNCCIHPGESAGKDAVMLLARELVISNAYPQILDSLIIAIIPIMNPDGHARSNPYNRINQKGPKSAGWRVTADRLNLNRDFMKADALEMRAFLHWYSKWQPHVFYDLHTTNGQDFQYVITYKVDTHPLYGGPLSRWVKEKFLPHVLQQSEDEGLLIGPYAGPLDPLHPEKGLMGGVWRPMLSNYYATLCNSIGFLVEAHSLKSYEERVQGTYDVLRIGLNYLAEHSGQLIQAVEQTRMWSAGFGAVDEDSNVFDIEFNTRTDTGDTIIFRGYEMETVKGSVSGRTYIKYSDSKRDVASVLFDDIRVKTAITAPRGYLIPVAWKEIADRLDFHGISYRKLKTPVRDVFECYRLDDVKFAGRSYEGRQRVSYTVKPFTDTLTFRAGSFYIPLGDEKSRLIMHLLEPYAPDALVHWGFMNTIFEQKEYFETYAMEPVAKKMMQDDPQLRARFEQKLETDQEFAENGRQRLYFFYRNSPYYDRELDVYPVARVTRRIDESSFE